MKNNVMYYYNILIKDIVNKNQYYYFTYKEQNYILIPYDQEQPHIYIIYNYLKYANIYCDEIIFNRDNKIFTLIDDKYYVLMKLEGNDIRVSLSNILNFKIPFNQKEKYNMKNNWMEKIDYYEYQVNQFGKRFPIIRKSFSYYVGLCEMGIALFNEINVDNIKLYIMHDRIYTEESYFTFYNPLRFIVDSKIRDIAEYLKVSFFAEKKVNFSIINYIISEKLNFDECLLFFIRMLYPSYYFDEYDAIMRGEEKEENLNKFIKKNTDYEKYLKKIYLEICQVYQLPYIEWITNA